MQRYAIFFIAVNALHVSGSFSAHHQKLKTAHTASGIRMSSLLAATASGSSKQASDILWYQLIPHWFLVIVQLEAQIPFNVFIYL